MRVLYFGTYERDYPRNAQVISCLRRAGVEVGERHVSVWEGRRHNWSAGAGAAARLGLAELELLRRPPTDFDAVLVGYPGHFDLPAARRGQSLRSTATRFERPISSWRTRGPALITWPTSQESRARASRSPTSGPTSASSAPAGRPPSR